jgi:hypothetical protein
LQTSEIGFFLQARDLKPSLASGPKVRVLSHGILRLLLKRHELGSLSGKKNLVFEFRLLGRRALARENQLCVESK